MSQVKFSVKIIEVLYAILHINMLNWHNYSENFIVEQVKNSNGSNKKLGLYNFRIRV